MSLRCHFDADGLLRGPISISYHMTPNRYDSGFAARAKGMVQHTEAGFRAGTFATFMDPGSQVSAFFSVGEDGAAHQYLPVGHGYVAWAEGEGNPHWYSCECEDKLEPGTPMPNVQLITFAQILEATAARDEFPLTITDDVNGTGLITHGDGKMAWGNHPDCPGDVRKAQRPLILALARAIRDGLDIWICQGQKSLHDLAAGSLGNPVHQVLQLTAEYSLNHMYEPDMATYLNHVFAADTAKVPAGITLHYPKGDGSIAEVSSHGDQTLLGTAEALHCQCSGIVRATAEHSPGAKFDGAMASYLDDVFGRSATHITQGIRVFYQK
jgi:hypothetical protein